MEKINSDLIIQNYNSEYSINKYAHAIRNIGLWESEQVIFTKYIKKDDKILDLCCGAGRTTFNLFEIGYEDITGVDIAHNLIEYAKDYNEKNCYEMKFIEEDATNLKSFPNYLFNAVFISYNSLMTIPKNENRLKCLREVNRVLKNNGILIFTTHDREDKLGESYYSFWEAERIKFENGKQNPRLHEFGDRIITDENNELIFIHIPNQKEVRQLLELANFELLETKMRYEISAENDKVREFSGECRFWVAKKKYR